MINEGGGLEGLAMRSSVAATGTTATTPACSISATRTRATRTTTSASADPKITRLHVEHAHGKHIFGRSAPGAIPKAWRVAKPETVAGPTGAATECGRAPAPFTSMTSLSSLFGYWTNAKKNKSASLRVQRFGDDPLRHLLAIQARLRARAFEFGPYKTFVVREKKHRHVVDAPMKDRIVHWLLYEYLLPIWQPRFIADTFGNLPGRGTHAAVRRLADFARGASAKWVLQLDISKYFYSVNHSLLKGMILRYIGDQDVRALLVNLVDSFRTGDEYDGLFAADTMYRRTAAKGMPIGSLTSQLFANIFLCAFDHWVKQTLRVKAYLRYVDDLTFMAETKEELMAISAAVVEYLAAMGLTIHPFKVRLAPAAAGIPYLGYVVWPNHISVGAYGRRRFHQRLRQHEVGGRDRSEALTSYKALFSHTGITTERKSK